MKNKQVRNYKQTIEKAKEFPSLSSMVEEYNHCKEQWFNVKSLVIQIQDEVDSLLKGESLEQRNLIYK